MNNLLVLALMIIAISFQGCGPSKVMNESDQASRIATTTTTSGTSSSDSVYTYCSKNEKGQLSLAVSAVGDALGGVDINLLYAKILAINTDFTESSDYIQFFKWKATADGIVYQEPTPLYFTFVSASSQVGLTVSPQKSANWDSMATAASYVSVANLEEFIDKAWMKIELKDPYGDYDVLRMVVYSKDHKAKHSLDVLMPVFDARPSAYAIEPDGRARSSALTAIHPLRESSGQESNTTHFKSLAAELCNPFR